MNVNSSGNMNNNNVNNTNGARPAVSLKPGTAILRGNGESTSPYVITEYVEQMQLVPDLKLMIINAKTLWRLDRKISIKYK